MSKESVSGLIGGEGLVVLDSLGSRNASVFEKELLLLLSRQRYHSNRYICYTNRLRFPPRKGHSLPSKLVQMGLVK